ncbi:MAG: hypothetical protein HY290_22690, partial [Planctomycetia bacterium]|nr:hypothetical protein [Planctomycetia bacterium]
MQFPQRNRRTPCADRMMRRRPDLNGRYPGRFGAALFVLFVICLLQSSAASAADAPTSSGAVLHLANDGFVAGELRENPAGSAIRWQSPAFAAPFEFPLGSVSAVHFPAPAKLPRPDAEWCFELEQGVVLFGSLVSWNSGELVVDAARIGRIHVRESSVHRFYRSRDSGDVVFLGPSGLAGWEISPARG